MADVHLFIKLCFILTAEFFSTGKPQKHTVKNPKFQPKVCALCRSGNPPVAMKCQSEHRAQNKPDCAILISISPIITIIETQLMKAYVWWHALVIIVYLLLNNVLNLN